MYRSGLTVISRVSEGKTAHSSLSSTSGFSVDLIVDVVSPGRVEVSKDANGQPAGTTAPAFPMATVSTISAVPRQTIVPLSISGAAQSASATGATDASTATATTITADAKIDIIRTNRRLSDAVYIDTEGSTAAGAAGTTCSRPSARAAATP